jgi:hypothetical protein
MACREENKMSREAQRRFQNNLAAQRKNYYLKRDIGSHRSTIHCPRCNKSFRGEDADKEYKEHYKKEHVK